jgi:23S rRNA (cytosine1962-C5)-methyltransferase
MQTLPTVLLRPGEADRVVAGHPWIYQRSIRRLTAPAGDGDVVQVKDHRQRFLGTGLYNSRSKINVRLLSPERVEVNRAFFEERIRASHELRVRHLPDATSCRIVNSESDFLSGLILDKYEDTFVLQISALGMERRKADIIAAVQSIFSPRGIVERSDVASRKFEGMAECTGIIAGDVGNGEVPVQLNRLKFTTNLLAGHKTGLYLDQQVNYRLVGEIVRQTPSARVLDCFSFVGGFALHAAAAGAAHVHAIEQSAETVEAAARNARDNGLAERCEFEAANVFDWLKAKTTTRPHEKVIPRYDVIILDPPSFTRNRASVGDALRGYKEIHLRALKLLRSGGTLVTFCCSHHVDANLFQQVIIGAAIDVGRVLRRVAIYAQSPDHPVLPVIPETEYLKGFAFEIAR